ncbi:hypothetical protein [Sphaerisporangium dianthi]|uniref:Uncharacterized protein n=1 Tax=Sphaerisporangium dianthi TaxID=1436120 RepID=A0ABV9CLX7_9ACTN
MFAAVALLATMIITVAMFELTVNNRRLRARPPAAVPTVLPEETAEDVPNVPNA